TFNSGSHSTILAPIHILSKPRCLEGPPKQNIQIVRFLPFAGPASYFGRRGVERNRRVQSDSCHTSTSYCVLSRPSLGFSTVRNMDHRDAHASVGQDLTQFLLCWRTRSSHGTDVNHEIASLLQRRTVHTNPAD